MSLFCKLNLHRWTEDNKLSKLMMTMEFGRPFGCTRCGIQKDELGKKFAPPIRRVNSMSDIHVCNVICIEHYNEEELKCPYCLEEGSDSYEVLMGDGKESGKTECGVCGKEYIYGTEITYRDGGVQSISYTTFQIEED